ncbi:helix-turn-helix domain-containing protein [Brachybacterium sp. MASK1Z-5]|uniref:Helix-turn-helix domain-containing protein n=1 Tax=Brachybacterium halotolerans TaxID=2795215 RepID=A0ABS1BAG0_9MICO|nr:helix-turn-helix domain-containing protein [Brachybacterium halotolerans]MBK0331598.1 helix-turn-helix domain-containing protein [Brachybacterium halotolerans]
MGHEVNEAARSVADKVMALLRAVGAAEEPMSLAALTAASGTSKSTCRRLLLDLSTQGYVRSPRRGMYAAGPRLQGLAAAVVRGDRMGGVIRESLGALARATGHVALRVSVIDERAVVLDLENPQNIPLDVHVGEELPAHRIWADGGGGRQQADPVDEYPSRSLWMLSAPIDEPGQERLALVGLAFMRPQSASASDLLAAHAGTLRDLGSRARDAG